MMDSNLDGEKVQKSCSEHDDRGATMAAATLAITQ